MPADPTSPPKAVVSRPNEDLSREIEKSMDRQPDERIKVIKLFDDCYRCNWWVADKTPHPFWLSGGTIRKSRFLRVTRTSTGLLKTDVTNSRAQRSEPAAIDTEPSPQH